MSRSREVPETVRRRFILGLLFVVTLGFLGMIQDFLVALLLAGLFAGLLHPLHRRASRSLGGHSAVAAVATIVASLFLVGLPVAGFGALVTAEALQLSEQVVPRMQSLLEEDARLASLLPDWLPYDERLAETLEPYRANAVRSLANATSTAGRWLVSGVSDLTQGTLRLALGFFVMIYAIFFFLLEGPALLRSLGSLLPLDPADRQLVLDRGLAVTKASFKGVLVIGALQGFLIGVGLWAAGISGAVFWATVTFVLSAVPGLGAPIVWIPASIWLLWTGEIGWGLALAVWGGVVVGADDNLLHPIVVGRDAKLPDLVVLVSVLGGISLFGAVGLLLGPLLASWVDTALEIYRRAFADWLPVEVEDGDEPPNESPNRSDKGRR